MLRRPGANRIKTAAAACFVAVALSAAAQRDGSSARIEELIKQGTAAIATGKYHDAIKSFKEGNKLQNSACFDCYLGLAVAYNRMGDLHGAQESSKKALTIASDQHQRSRAHTLMGSVLMTFSGGDPKMLADAEEEFRQALAQDKDDPGAHFQLGVVLLKQKRDEKGKNELKACLELAPAGPYAEQARRVLADPRRARERFAPDFEVTTLQGESLSLSRLAGKVIVLDFWATWCPPCRASVPELKDLVKKYPRDKLVLISISADHDQKAWREFIAKKAMDWPQFRDSDQQVQRVFGVHSFPTYLVIDGEGIIQQQIVGEDPQKTVVYRLRDTLKSFKQLSAER